VAVKARDLHRDIAEIVRNTQAFAQCFDQRDAALLVTDMPRQYLSGRFTFAEIMQQGGKRTRVMVISARPDLKPTTCARRYRFPG